MNKQANLDEKQANLDEKQANLDDKNKQIWTKNMQIWMKNRQIWMIKTKKSAHTKKSIWTKKQVNLDESVLYIVYLLIVVGTVTNRHQPCLTLHQTFSLKIQPIKRK